MHPSKKIKLIMNWFKIIIGVTPHFSWSKDIDYFTMEDPLDAKDEFFDADNPSYQTYDYEGAYSFFDEEDAHDHLYF